MEGLSTVTIDGQVYEMWDATKLKSYACETRGKYEHEEHLTPKEPSEAIAFGQAMHKAIEEWTKYGENPQSIEIAEAAFAKAWEAMLPLEAREMLELSGDRRSYENFKRLFAGFRKKFPLSMFEKIIEVEKSFALPLGKTARGVSVAWCGKRDRVLQWQGGIYYTDIKTSTYALDEAFFEKWKRSGQMIGYAWAGQQELGLKFAGILIQGIQVQAPLKTKVRLAEELIQADTVLLTEDNIDEWRKNTLLKIDRIHLAREQGVYTMDNGDLCNSFNRPCAFAGVCNARPEMRPMLKQLHFKTRVWNPVEEASENG